MSAVDTLPAPRVVRGQLWPLYKRSLRNTLRLPSTLIPPLFIPVFFLIVNTEQLGGALGQLADTVVVILDAIPLVTYFVGNASDAAGSSIRDSYVTFFLPVSVVLSVASAGNGSGLSLVQDISSGYFDKLLLSPISRTSLLISRLLTDGTRAALQTAVVVIAGTILGASFATGPLGILAAIGIAFLFGVAFAGISLNIALRTGNPEATQASFVLFFPAVFLAPTFVPLQLLPPWMEAVARCNPITYVLGGMRSIFLNGWELSPIVQALAAVLLLAIVTLTLAFRALQARANG